MNLESYLRSEINLYIRPLFIKNECEYCGAIDNLHLHHNYQFFKIVDDVLKMLNLEMKDTDDYTEQELYMIKSCVLAEHLKDNYKTLCQECHVKEHIENRQGRNIKQKPKFLPTNEEKIYHLIESYAGQRLFKEQQYELFEELYELGICSKRKEQLNTMKAVNKWLKENLDCEYEFESKKERSRKSEHYNQNYIVIK